MRLLPILTFLTIVFLGPSCKTLQNANLYSVQDDITLGKQVAAQIEAEPSKYPILSEQSNPQVYSFLRKMRDRILSTGRVQYSNQFSWDLKVIKDDKTLNAFCTPGGHIYIYTGLIKFLDTEDELAGVMGHEMAHAAKRHSTRQMTKMLPISVIASVLSGNDKTKEQIAQVTSALIGLKFSREHETEADENSVLYLCPTGYQGAGAAGFFKKIEGKGGQPPQFLSTHPSPANRVQNIEAKANKLGCPASKIDQSEFRRIKASL